jgi:hypothetical protein
MISAFVSQEFGFGFYVSLEDLEKVNKEREGKSTVMKMLQKRYSETASRHHLPSLHS